MLGLIVLKPGRPIKNRSRQEEIGLCRISQRPILPLVYQRFWRSLMEVHRGIASVRFWVFSIGFSIVLASPIAAQIGGDPAKVRMQEQTRRELQLNGIVGDGRSNDPKRSQALMAQVGEDFQRILTLHNEIVRAIAGNKSLSYQF